MDDIDDYNADVKRLRVALDAQGESAYVWGVRGYCPDPYDVDAGLREIQVRAKTKRSYDKGRLRIFTYINRDLLRSDLAMSLAVLKHSADLALEDKLAEADDESA